MVEDTTAESSEEEVEGPSQVTARGRAGNLGVLGQEPQVRGLGPSPSDPEQGPVCVEPG